MAVSVGATGVPRGIVTVAVLDANFVLSAFEVAVSVTVYSVLEEAPVTVAVVPTNEGVVNHVGGDTA